MTRWWKCDLQVASPGEPRFRGPGGEWNLTTIAGRAAAADRYMAAVVESGVEVLALADHNSVEWVDVMRAAGRRHGVVVFPGFEVTTATGSDGVHAVLIGDPECTVEQLREVLYGACKFSSEHPAFNPSTREPASSPQTLPQILDSLPDGFLVLAPHVFNENGLASPKTLKGDLRWKALHHERLGAVDVGDVAELLEDSSPRGFKRSFVQRALDDFPCLEDLAFVATSDAYTLDQFGSRFTWIRMETPSIEGLRQAFLDHGARIICDWDPRYRIGEVDPNRASHAYVSRILLNDASNAGSSIAVEFDPRLNVIIGGRGSGKSTLVAALRCLYGDIEGLPKQAQTEAREFVDTVFGSAKLASTHHLAHSGASQEVAWSTSTGSVTTRADGQETTTDFKVRVVSQKELFERAANTPDNPHATSQNLLKLVDDALSVGVTGPGSPGGIEAAFDELRSNWVAAARTCQSEREAVAQKVVVAERVEELRGQIAAFDSDANRSRRVTNDDWLAQQTWLDNAVAATVSDLDRLRDVLGSSLDREMVNVPETWRSKDDASSGLTEQAARLADVREKVRGEIRSALEKATAGLAEFEAARTASEWQAGVDGAVQDAAAFLTELEELGLSPDAYGNIRSQLSEQSALLADLERREQRLDGLRHEEGNAWRAMETALSSRRQSRQAFLEGVAERSRILRFRLDANGDTTSWVVRVRALLGLRSDGFIDEVPALAEWLWEPAIDHVLRQLMWRDACISGDFSAVATSARMRSAWVGRLRALDPIVRARLAAEFADDAVSMDFLRANSADGREEWQPLTSGSPGQRSAAMLSLVLNHGEEPLVLDQPEDDLDTEWITQLVVAQFRDSRWRRQLIVVTHNANIPVNADAERVIVLENGDSGVRVRRESGESSTPHCGPIENALVRADIQQIMEGGVEAFVRRERRYNNELNMYKAAMHEARRKRDRRSNSVAVPQRTTD